MKNFRFVSWLFLLSSLLPACHHAAPSQAKVPPLAQEDLTVYKSADELWNHIGSLLDFLDTDPAQADPVALKKAQQALILAEGAAQEFINLYPKDDRRWKVRLLLLNLHEAAGHYGLEAVSPEMMEQEMRTLAQLPGAPLEMKASLSSELISHTLEKVSLKHDPAQITLLDQQIDAFTQQFGTQLSLEEGRPPEAALLRWEELHVLLQSGSDDQVAPLLKKIDALSRPELSEMAREEIAGSQAERRQKEKPFTLKFTALDGRVVDVSQMKGKVVLLDFWSTDCVPCVQKVPELVALDQKYHQQGLEIIGLSLDKDKEVLREFTHEHGMTWPQYFGLDWPTVAARYNIQAIPTAWLIDKKGQVVDLHAEQDLENKVAELLAP